MEAEQFRLDYLLDEVNEYENGVGFGQGNINRSSSYIIPFTEEMIKSAHEKVLIKQGEISPFSEKNKTAQFAGFLSEEAIAAYFGGKLISFDNNDERRFDYDLVVDNRHIEIKAKQRTVPPQPHYTVGVGKHSEHQDADMFYFTSLEWATRTDGLYAGLKHIWFVGGKQRDDFFEQAELVRKDQHQGYNGWRASADVYNLPISKLDAIYV